MTGGPAGAFKRLLDDGVGPVLRVHGWAGSGGNWQKPDPENWVLWNWQKSRHSTADLIEFTGNLHIVTRDWYDSQNVPPGRVPSRPTTSHAGIGTRLGQLLPERSDRWWQLRGDDDVPDLTASLGSALVSAVFPAVDQRLAELSAAPRECWHNVGGRSWFEKCGRPATEQRTVGVRRYWRCAEHLALIGDRA